jgi:DNA-binding LytR/AlgR family response regulator
MSNNKILIFEDDIYIATEIAARIRLSNLGEPIITHTVDDCLAALKKHTVNLAILDIEIPGISDAGFQVARQLGNVAFLFLSGHNHKRFSAYKLGPQAFLKKPFDENTINSIELALLRPVENKTIQGAPDEHYFSNDAVFIYHQGTNFKVPINDILFVKLEDGCLRVQLEAKSYHVWVTIDSFLKQAGAVRFLRIHRSHAVNFDHLVSFNAEEVKVGRHTLSVSKSGIQQINLAAPKIQSKPTKRT